MHLELTKKTSEISILAGKMPNCPGTVPETLVLTIGANLDRQLFSLD